MKKEVESAFQDMQEALREHDGGGTIDVDAYDLLVVLRWAEKHGLTPDYREDDRVRLNRKGANAPEGYFLREGALGTVYSVFDPLGHGGFLRVVWDDDPMDGPQPMTFYPREVERVYE